LRETIKMNTVKIVGLVIMLTLAGSFFFSQLAMKNTITGTILKLKIEPVPIYMINENIVEDLTWDLNLTARQKQMPKSLLNKAEFEHEDEKDLITEFGTDIQYKIRLEVSNVENRTLFSKMKSFIDGRPLIIFIYLNQSEAKVNEDVSVKLTLYLSLDVPPPADKIVTRTDEEVLTATVELGKW
jgi:hypothetical protein